MQKDSSGFDGGGRSLDRSAGGRRDRAEYAQ